MGISSIMLPMIISGVSIGSIAGIVLPDIAILVCYCLHHKSKFSFLSIRLFFAKRNCTRYVTLFDCVIQLVCCSDSIEKT